MKTEKNCAHNTDIKDIINFKKIIRKAYVNDWISKDIFYKMEGTLKTVEREFLDVKKSKDKIKFEIGFDNQLFAFAGLYANNTYTIVTTEAKGVMRDIHDTKLRMPFSLKSASDFKGWLNNKEVAPQYNFTTTQLDFTQPTLF
ncbi:SOS response-associated peptidase family protein [Polaribacter sp. M15]